MKRATLLAACLVAIASAKGRADRPEMAKPWLGVQLSEGEGGVEIDQVFVGSPAEGAGLHVGDVVQTANGSHLTKPADLVAAVEHAGVGANITLHVLGAGGSARDVAVELIVRPDIRRMQRTQLVGHAAPDFEIKRALGVYAARLRALKGQVVLLDFWATWCGPCMAALPHIQELHDRFRGKGLRVIGVAADDWGRVGEVVKRRGLTYAQVSDEDGQIGSRYFVTAIPTLVLIGKDGKVADVSIGEMGTIERSMSELLR